jgi:hypothetical protein
VGTCVGLEWASVMFATSPCGRHPRQVGFGLGNLAKY